MRQKPIMQRLGGIEASLRQQWKRRQKSSMHRVRKESHKDYHTDHTNHTKIYVQESVLNGKGPLL